MNRAFIDFVHEHENDDTARLLLSAARYPDIDMPLAVQQIEGRRTARQKWPSLLACDEYLYPPRLNREQASSEATARYKASLLNLQIPNSEFRISNLIDLTGGMGIDALAFAKAGFSVDYVERDAQLCQRMEHNVQALGLSNVAIHCADSVSWLRCRVAGTSGPAVIYIDPARRSASGGKVAAFEDCQPNLLEHLPLLLSNCRCLMVKASPMIDIDLACRQLGHVTEVHVVAVAGECKEVLFWYAGFQPAETKEPSIHCVDLPWYAGFQPVEKMAIDAFSFTRSEESSALCRVSGPSGLQKYLYLPSAALMKGGAYKLIAQRYDLLMLSPGCHVYTADTVAEDFPGRVFRVLGEVKLSRKAIAEAVPDGKAHVVTRSYPVAAADLQKQLGLKEGGDFFVVATTVGHRRCGFLCERI